MHVGKARHVNKDDRISGEGFAEPSKKFKQNGIDASSHRKMENKDVKKHKKFHNKERQ